MKKIKLIRSQKDFIKTDEQYRKLTKPKSPFYKHQQQRITEAKM